MKLLKTLRIDNKQMLFKSLLSNRQFGKQFQICLFNDRSFTQFNRSAIIGILFWNTKNIDFV